MRFTLLTRLLAWSLASWCLFGSVAQAKEPDSCQAIRFGYLEWTDLEVTTGVAQVLLESLGYQVSTSVASVGDVYAQLADDKMDVFLGNWMPASASLIGPYLDKREIDVLQTNLTGALYTLAVPRYVYDQGVTTVADLVAHADRFNQRIYGLEKGNDGNVLIQSMIDKNAFGLKDFKLIETSEFLMLAQVKGKIRRSQWIAFLGWKPHPMNRSFDIAYLGGADDYFGPNKGASKVRTIVRHGFGNECHNVSALLANMLFDIDMLEQVMDYVINGFAPVDRAVRLWLKENPDQVDRWLKGVHFVDGRPARQQDIAAGIALF